MSPSSCFPLLNLPLLAFENVINVMNPDIILDLAFLSKSFKSYLSAVKFKIDSFEWTLTQNQIGVTINLYRSWNIRIQSNCAFKSEPRNVNGTTVPLASYNCPFGGTMWFLTPGYSESSKLAMLETLTSFLMSFVRCSRFKLEYSLEHNLLSKDFFVWKYVKGKPIDLAISGIQNAPLEMSSEVLKFILEDLKCDKLKLNVDVKDFKFEGPLETKELIISHGNFLDLRQARLNCETLRAWFEPEDVNQLLQNWIRGESLAKLEFLRMFNDRSVDPVVLKGIQNCKSRFSFSDIVKRIGNTIRKSDCRDIQRESDGRWGTLVRNEIAVYFIVWESENSNE